MGADRALCHRPSHLVGEKVVTAVELRDLRTSSAEFSPDLKYRYVLMRRWADGPTMLFIGLNPSTATAREDDPTIRRLLGFAKREGCGTLVVVNLFALRSTDPSRLKEESDPVGPDNDLHIVEAAKQVDIVLAGWGGGIPAAFKDRPLQVLGLLQPCRIWSLGLTERNGWPKHPLYVPADRKFELYGFKARKGDIVG